MVSDEVVAGLEHLLDLARRGEISSLGCAIVYDNGTVDTTFDIADGQENHILVAAATLLVHDLCEFTRATDD